ncbi:hypothetical protein BST61_g6774 [Cercospora zeina]
MIKLQEKDEQPAMMTQLSGRQMYSARLTAIYVRQTWVIPRGFESHPRQQYTPYDFSEVDHLFAFLVYKRPLAGLIASRLLYPEDYKPKQIELTNLSEEEHIFPSPAASTPGGLEKADGAARQFWTSPKQPSISESCTRGNTTVRQAVHRVIPS